MSNILLYFGSFNPPHRGHTSISKYTIEKSICDELWIVISPQNPLKNSDLIISKEHRSKMVELALEEEGLSSRVKVCLIEFELPTPSYTADTLQELVTRSPMHTFSILIGGDNQNQFQSWKNWDYIAENHNIYVYPRPGSSCNIKHRRLEVINDAPLMNNNSTEIRKSLTNGADGHQWLHKSVLKYIKDRGLWLE